MKNDDLIQKTQAYLREQFKNESSGHDWWHIFRVWQLAKIIGTVEGTDLFLTEMAALLHDLDDWKLSDSTKGLAKASRWMDSLGIAGGQQEKIRQVIAEVSFKGAGVDTKPSSVESKVVQDADRLDAIGAIGIARTFAYGGFKNRLIYDPDVEPENHDSFSSYQQSAAPTINHFYEKLLLLKDRMNTETGKQLAESRHQFMEDFLKQFYSEWTINEQILTFK